MAFNHAMKMLEYVKMSGTFNHLASVMLITFALLVGCYEPIDAYIPASSISRHGYALNGDEIGKKHGQEIQVWGFVDHSNIYGNEGAKQILEEWWSGEGPSRNTWRFNLKSSATNQTGQSFPVYVLNDPGRDDLLKAFVADARAYRPTRVFIKGKLSVFDAPTNARLLSGLSIETQSSQDIQTGVPGKIEH